MREKGRRRRRRKRDPESKRSEVIPVHLQVQMIRQIPPVSRGKGPEENKAKLKRRIRRK